MDRIVQFGPDNRLVGVLTGAGLPDTAPVLVLPSAGLLPRGGPFRLHVELGRRLAPLGIRTFRFEAPGVGETPRVSGLDSRGAALAAIDHLAEAFGCRDFVVGGLCSAADVGWHAAVADPRVRGMVLLDGVSYVGPWFHLGRFGNLMRRPAGEWLGVARRWWGRTRTATGAPDMGAYREWPARAQARKQFAALLDRGVRSLWIYTGGYADRFLHLRQFAWSFGPAARDARVTLHYWPDCDHTFYARAHRDRLVATLENWLLDAPGRAGAPA